VRTYLVSRITLGRSQEPLAAHRIPLLVQDDGGLLVHHEQERPLEGDDGEGLISGVEHECAHGVPFDRGWMASSRVNGSTRRAHDGVPEGRSQARAIGPENEERAPS
jgi:hypothetical protein